MARPVELGVEAVDLARWVRPGDGIVWGQACAEPVVLVDALLHQAEELAPLAAFAGLCRRDLPFPDGMRVVSYGGLGRLGRLAGLEVVPCVPLLRPARAVRGRAPAR